MKKYIKGDTIISESDLFYEYCYNDGVVVMAIDRNRAGPLLTALNATFKKMKLRHSEILDHG